MVSKSRLIAECANRNRGLRFHVHLQFQGSADTAEIDFTNLIVGPFSESFIPRFHGAAWNDIGSYRSAIHPGVKCLIALEDQRAFNSLSVVEVIQEGWAIHIDPFRPAGMRSKERARAQQSSFHL
jgi:hypothetical protein